MENSKFKSENSEGIISVCLELSDQCKVGCPYCLLEEKVQEISQDHILSIIRSLKDYGVERYTIGGGEPLEVSYVYEVGKFIKQQLGKKTLLRTSACNLMNCETVKKAFDIVDISIDSYKRSTLELCKPNIDHDVVFQNIKNLIENDIFIRCNILITQYNYGDVIQTIRWLAKVGVKHVRIQKLVSRGKAKYHFQDIFVPDDEYSKLLDLVFTVCTELEMEVEEVKSVASQTLCIVKPNGNLYVGTPTGLIYIGDSRDRETLRKASKLVSKNQKEIYGDVLNG